MKKSIFKRKRFWLLAVFLIFIAYLLTLRPVRIMLQTAPNTPDSQIATPEISSDFLDQKNAFLSEMENTIFGTYPSFLSLDLIEQQKLETGSFSGKADINVYRFKIINERNDQTAQIHYVQIDNLTGSAPSPLILTQNFCPNHNVVPVAGIPVPPQIGFSCDGEGHNSCLQAD